jgi:hypothetical protein
MAGAYGTYVARMNDVAVSTAVTVVYISNSASAALRILRVSCNQRTSTSSAMNILSLLRKSGTVTLPTSTTPVPLQVGMAASGVTCTTGVASAEGSDGVILHKEGFNILNGLLWIPTPEEQPWVPPSGAVGLKFEIAPTSATYTIELTYTEIA